MGRMENGYYLGFRFYVGLNDMDLFFHFGPCPTHHQGVKIFNPKPECTGPPQPAQPHQRWQLPADACPRVTALGALGLEGVGFCKCREFSGPSRRPT